MTPVEKIAGWASSKPVWWRHAIRLALADGRLSEERFDEILEVARMEHGLIERCDRFDIWAQPLDINGYTSEEFEVSLTSISAVKGINTLAEDQHLDFPPQGLVIVYGDNGSGKSSYTSILKNACLTRGECQPVRGNVFRVDNPTPEATLGILSKGVPAQFVWTPRSMSEASLKSIRVFDSSSAAHYVNKEDTLNFNPAGLHLLTDLAAAVAHIRNIIDEECQPGNGFLPLKLPETSGSVSLYLRSLNATSDEDMLRGFVATEAESAQIEPLMREIAHHYHSTPENVRNLLRQRELVLTALTDHIQSALVTLNNTAIENILALFKDYEGKRELAENLKAFIFTGMPFKNLGGQEWVQIWQSARAFVALENADAVFPMQTGDSCPLCLQEVTNASAARLAMLDEYLANRASREAQAAYDKYTGLVTRLRQLNLSLNSYQASLHEMDNLIPGSAEKILSLFNSLEERRRLLTTAQLADSLPEIDYEAATHVKNQRDTLRVLAESLTSDNDLNALIRIREGMLADLQERNFVKIHLDALINNLDRHKMLQKLSHLRDECITQSISRLSSQINQADVVEPLVQAFQTELSTLGFNRFTVKVESRNRSGHQQFKLVIEQSNESVVSKVASEGEQRCIALASFFAEMRADRRKSSVIFDDPVNSLSHQWRAVIARRLAAESAHRQVIVFTHDLVFYKWLIEEANFRQSEHFELSLDRTHTAAGFVRKNPPWDALSTRKRIKKLRGDLILLRKSEQTMLHTDFIRVAGLFYSELRETWERLVEEKLLNSVVTRFERGVSTRRLNRLIDITQDDYDLIDGAMSKCSTYFIGHDSATAVGNPSPTAVEMERDLKVIDDYNDILQKERKRN